MAAPQRLGNGSLTPSANPVSSFLQFDANSQPAAPGQRPRLSSVKGITSFQQGGQSNVRGVNPLAELTEALAPLSKLYDAGAEMYASDQYKQGQNELLRAAQNINRDTIIKGLAYADQNREVDRSNPVAGMLMDQANPFRQAGRVNQASQWVAQLTPQLMRAEWAKSASDLRKLDPSDPAVMAVQASVTNRLVSAFGLDEFSPGFQSYVAPAVNKSWEWFQQQQYKARVAYEKEVGARQTSDVMVSMLTSTNGASPGDWSRMLAMQAAQYGLAGEPEKMTREAVLATAQRLRLMAQNPETAGVARAALARLKTMPSGLTSADGQQITVGDAFGAELLSDAADLSRDAKTLRDNQEAEQTSALQRDPVFEGTIGLDPSSPEWKTKFDELRKNPAYSALSDAQLRQLLIDQSKQSGQWQDVTFDKSQVDAFLAKQENQYGSKWDEGAANKRWQDLIKNAPPEVRQRLQQRWNDLRDRKRSERKGDIDSSTATSNLDKRTQQIAKQLVPGAGPELLVWMQANPGGDIIEWLGTKDAKKAEVIASVRNLYQRDALTAIRKETAEKGGRLDPVRQAEIWDEVWRANKDDYIESMQPALEVGKTSDAKAEPQAPPRQTYSVTQPVPEAVVKAGGLIYKPTAVRGLAQSLANGKPIPAQVKRAARAAGKTPGEFVLDQAVEAGLKIPGPMIKTILRQSNQSMGLQQSLVGMSPGSGPLSQSTGVLLSILTGTAPTYRSITG